ncbi:MAG: helix-turn-helix transcriptional regulator [Armatimonadetes bacterium]|nr:helix-turn-helix transcriptional regulator [Armatimonadota bacterium]
MAILRESWALTRAIWQITLALRFAVWQKSGMTLDDYLKSKGIRPTDFAASLSVPPSTVARWLKGSRKPRLEFLLRIQAITKGAVKPSDFSAPSPDIRAAS